MWLIFNNNLRMRRNIRKVMSVIGTGDSYAVLDIYLLFYHLATETEASQLRYQQSLNCSTLQLSVYLISLHFQCLNFMVILCSAVPWVFFLLNISTLVLCINHSYRKKNRSLSSQHGNKKNNSWKKGAGGVGRDTWLQTVPLVIHPT